MPNVVSPMMQQYRRMRAQNPDCILFFRLGDFYEMFFEDAELVSRELQLTLTGRDCGMKERAPMCGVPFHSWETYAARLLRKGYKVAICEQMEDPALAKGLVRREVVRVITPGTVLEGPLLEEGRNNFLGAVCEDGESVGLAFLDISTGEMTCTQLLLRRHPKTGKPEQSRSAAEAELVRFAPSELLVFESLGDRYDAFAADRLNAPVTRLPDDTFGEGGDEALFCRQFGADLDALGMRNRPIAVRAAAMLLSYLARTHKDAAGRITACPFYRSEQYMVLDPMSIRNLELLETMRGGERVGSLLHVLDKTRTAMGKRLMRFTVERPLLDYNRILRRQDAVARLIAQGGVRADLTDRLAHVFDLERLMTRVQVGICTPRDLTAMCAAVRVLPSIKECLAPFADSALLRELDADLDPLDDIAESIGKAIVDDPPVSISDGGVIREGYDPQVDEYRDLEQNARSYLADLEYREREATGIKNLRVVYNRVFGYAIEVTKSYASLVPDTYIRKQTLTGSERYITPELKELEGKILNAREKLLNREQVLFLNLRQELMTRMQRVQKTAQAVARLDVLCSFANVSQENGYCRPEISVDRSLRIVDGRHPVIERLLDIPFVSNDTQMDGGDNRVMVITGPNMAGKSTYMRQVALIVLMAQLGCFVPARSARIGLCDAIFTRVGAADDLASGQSTFMVEMNEVAYILRHATADSLILLDEIGRGTSTYDGMSIARAVVEYAADPKKLGARTLFATHYHELTELEDQLEGVKNYNIAAIRKENDLTFLRKIVRGGADESYGIDVAKLAGVPEPVLRRARVILRQLEEKRPVERTQAKKREESPQMAFISPREQKLVDLLSRIDMNNMTPIESLNRLYELVQIVRNE